MRTDDNNTLQQLERATELASIGNRRLCRHDFDSQFTNGVVERVLKQTIALIAEIEAYAVARSART